MSTIWTKNTTFGLRSAEALSSTLICDQLKKWSELDVEQNRNQLQQNF